MKDFCCGPDTRRRDDDERRFVAAVLGNPFVGEILERMRGIALPHWYLTGGCLFQTVWNGAHGLPAATGILDYDLFYFDGHVVSAEAEQRIGLVVERAVADLPVTVEATNQARVHQWYEGAFGAPCRAFARCEDGIDGFLATCCCIGIRRDVAGAIDLYAPHGYDDLFHLVVRPNPARTVHSDALRHAYAAKVRRWSDIWPRLQVLPWPDAPPAAPPPGASTS